MKKLLLVLFVCAISAILISCVDTPPAQSDSTSPEESVVDSDSEEPEDSSSTEEEEEYVPPRIVKIACVGDSITYGLKSTSTLNTYPSQLKLLLGKKYDVQNYGRSSSYMIDPKDYPDYKYIADRSVAYKQTNEYKNSIAYNPDIGVICLGANDAYVSNTNSGVNQSKYYYDSAVAMAKMYQSLPAKPKVVFMYPPARFDAQYRLDYIKNTIIPLLNAAAKECGCDVIDLFSATEQYAKNKDTKYIDKDGIHLADAGYAVMAQVVYEVVKDYRLAE